MLVAEATASGRPHNLCGAEPKAVRQPNLCTTRDFWLEAVALAPEHTAVVDGDRRLTYARAASHVERLAAGIVQATKGAAQPKVAVFLPNCLEYYLLYWAIQRLGGVVVPLNTWLKEDSLAGIFRTVKPEALLVRSPDDAPVLRAFASRPVNSSSCPMFAQKAIISAL